MSDDGSHIPWLRFCPALLVPYRCLRNTNFLSRFPLQQPWVLQRFLTRSPVVLGLPEEPRGVIIGLGNENRQVGHSKKAHKPLHVRVPQRPAPPVFLHAPPDPDLPSPRLRAAQGPHRHPHRGAGIKFRLIERKTKQEKSSASLILLPRPEDLVRDKKHNQAQ